MIKNIMVGYATWSGTTHEVAVAIGEQLTSHGFEVDIVDLKQKTFSHDYDGYVIGTSIHASKPTGTFMRFVRNNHDLLSSKPTAFFVVCANMYEDTAENRAETEDWLKDALHDLPEIPVLDTGLFGGAVITSGDDFDKLNFILKFIIRSKQKSITEKMGKEDFRDWEKIRNWADEIAVKIK